MAKLKKEPEFHDVIVHNTNGTIERFNRVESFNIPNGYVIVVGANARTTFYSAGVKKIEVKKVA